jgi:hypothetical protein
VKVWVRTALCVLAAALVTAPGAAAQNAQPTLSLRLHFHRIATNAAPQVAFAGPYVFYETPATPLPAWTTQLMMVDERTGTSVPLSPPGCGGQPVNPISGGGWLVVGCNGQWSSVRLYNLSTGVWTTVALAPSLQATCEPSGSWGCGVVGVGAYWLKISEGCYHCRTTYVLQNIQTGATERDPAVAGSNVYDDLDSPTGHSTACAPLVVRSGGGSDGGIGSLQFYGQFAVSTRADSSDPLLVRCGSTSRVRLNGAFVSDQAIVWGPTAIYKHVLEPGTPGGAGVAVWEWVPVNYVLHGFYLPRERPFTIPDPLAKSIAGIANRTLYLHDDGLVAATLPPAPRQSRRS